MSDQIQISSMRLITLHVPQRFIEALDELVAKGWYPNRSEAIRVAIRDFLKEMKKIIEMEHNKTINKDYQKQ
ncbi:MAG: ribbon-helix-helix domain-containing protein [Crenarchaeota archaeon]|nr:ribbon-helix-helix domain-containing protein [Thermoproteota archaeon]MCR8454485.1 ribbon-helix-helix domain-containing protein [Thermoproteota archaeon]MCR8455100.1 ribbon-helix-helix domain-containing protein [Thermoproteota archaeon]MCR8462814.1 ribbon-helix-helix domain-containing protein [Thermoproteota archaeon]MCR8472513.1 ribbon-helix-helix domain-containing protein [Thermoproteota archaeon]